MADNDAKIRSFLSTAESWSTDKDVDDILNLAMDIRAIDWDDPNDLENLLWEKVFPIDNAFDIIRATDLFAQLDPKYSRFGWFRLDIADRLLSSWPEPITMDEHEGKWVIYRFPLARLIREE